MPSIFSNIAEKTKKILQIIAEPANSAESKESKKTEQTQPAITIDDVCASIDTCKSTLHSTKYTPEEISRFTEILDLMQKAVRGLQSKIDVTLLLTGLRNVFSESLPCYFESKDKEQIKHAFDVISEAKNHITSNEDSQITLAACRLQKLANEALILHHDLLIKAHNVQYSHLDQQLITVSQQPPSQHKDDLIDVIQTAKKALTANNNKLEGELKIFNANIINIDVQMKNLQTDSTLYMSPTFNQQMKDISANTPSPSELTRQMREEQDKFLEEQARNKAETERYLKESQKYANSFNTTTQENTQEHTQVQTQEQVL